jgi:hypothetical protein
MKKFFVLFFSFILLASSAFAEKLPDATFTKPITLESHPLWYKYLDDYTNQLYNAFDPTKFRRHNGYGTTYTYIINKGGSVTWISKLVYKSKIEKYVRNLILETTPPPFPKELQDDDIRIDIYIGHDKYPEKYFKYYGFNKTVHIFLSK